MTVTDERLATLIAWAEECSKPWISVDVPAALRELQSLRCTCEWVYDDDGFWLPSCGGHSHATTWEGDDLAGDGVKFCCYCGKKILALRAAGEQP